MGSFDGTKEFANAALLAVMLVSPQTQVPSSLSTSSIFDVVAGIDVATGKQNLQTAAAPLRKSTSGGEAAETDCKLAVSPDPLASVAEKLETRCLRRQRCSCMSAAATC
jgi:hypothetical protein